MHSTKIPIPLGGARNNFDGVVAPPHRTPRPSPSLHMSTCLTSTTSRDLRYTSSRSPHVVQQMEHVADDQMVSIVRRKKS